MKIEGFVNDGGDFFNFLTKGLIRTDTKPGARLVYCYPRNGTSLDQTHAAEFLKVGEVYVVDDISVTAEDTSVKLVGIEGEWFNGVLFRNHD